jgi:urea transport system ATP-binding protein
VKARNNLSQRSENSQALADFNMLTSAAGERTLILVEHDMTFVSSIARTVTVLHQGSMLAEGCIEQSQNNQKVIDLYLGESQ